jgi:hypothetical protein
MENRHPGDEFDPRPLFFQLSWWQRIGIWLLGAVVIGLVVLYAFELPRFQNTFDARRMTLWSLAVGAVAGLVAGWLGQRKATSTEERIQAFMLLFLPWVVFAPLLCSLTNRWAGQQEARPCTVEFWQLESRISSRGGMLKGEKPEANQFFLYFVRDGQLERIQVPSAGRFRQNQRGDTIELPIRSGFWGYRWIDPQDLR